MNKFLLGKVSVVTRHFTADCRGRAATIVRKLVVVDDVIPFLATRVKLINPAFKVGSECNSSVLEPLQGLYSVLQEYRTSLLAVS